MNRLMLLAISIPLLGLLVLSSLFIVDQRQYAAVYALGEIKRVIETPGLHFKLPPPFQNVTYFDKRILTIDTPDTDRFITSEKLNLQVDSFVKWRIVDVKAFIRSVSGSQSIAADRLLRSLRDAMNIEISKITVAELISGEREKIVEELRNKLNDAAKEIVGAGGTAGEVAGFQKGRLKVGMFQGNAGIQDGHLDAFAFGFKPERRDVEEFEAPVDH
ncbi:MAG: hypothetical protein EBW20_09875, partial [Betaproteobacteria bacterium]|nr:hypothetical protein [Betaproteobacteria bacterium]